MKELAARLAAYEDTGLDPEEIEQLKRERDAAIEDLNKLRKKTGWKCEYCYYSDNYDRDICCGCEYNNDNNWKWRGVQKEER